MIASHASTILLIAGILTAGLLIGVFVPQLVLGALLGVDEPSPAVVLMARHWALLIGLVGVLLIYAAGHAEARFPVLVAGAVEKLLFVAMIFLTPLRRRLVAAFAATADAIMTVLFIVLLAHGS